MEEPQAKGSDEVRTKPPEGVAIDTAVPVGSRPVLAVTGLGKRYRRADGTVVRAVKDVSFELHAGEIMVLLGPSGCGKTTLLRCIAGLEQPDAGTIEVQGQTVFCADQVVNVPAERRKLSMVLQSYALWPHMTVAENISYPLRSLPRSKRPSKSEIAQRVDQIMEVVGIAALKRQHPNAISGGQQQRVALGRALIAGTSLVLFDEPLSNVDAQVREILRTELLVMQRELQFAALFVTHDRQEAMVLGKQIAVLEEGQVAQLGTPTDIYNAPRNAYVARFIGPMNEVPVIRVANSDADGASVETELGLISGCAIEAGGSGQGLVAVWRPERAVVSAARPVTLNSWQGVVEDATFFGSHSELVVSVNGRRFRVLVDGNTSLPSGSPAWLSIDPRDVKVLPS